MSKELNILQAIEMPAWTEFNVIYKDSIERPIKTFLDKNRNFVMEIDGDFESATHDFITAKFIPVQKPVSFMRAVESGRRIKVEHNLIDDAILNKKDIYFRSDSPHNRKALEMFRRKEFMSPNLLFSALGYLFDGSEIAEIVNNGKWYIEEE